MLDAVPELQNDDFAYRLYPSLIARPEALVVVLHGYDSSIDYMHETCVSLRDKLKSAAIVAPQARIALNKKNKPAPTYSWIDINSVSNIVKSYVSYTMKRRLGVTDKLIGFIDRRREELGLDISKVALSGHSLGAIMGFMIAAKTKIGSLISMSGVAPACIDLSGLAKNNTPVHYIMGGEDEVFVKTSLVDKKYKLLEHFKRSLGLDRSTTLKRLNESGIRYSDTVLNGYGHDLGDHMVSASVGFLYNDLNLS